MFIGRVVENQIHDDFYVALICRRDELVKVCKRAESRINARVVSNVVAVVDHGRRINRRQPNRTDAKAFDVVKLINDAAQVTGTAARRVKKTFRVNLVDGFFLPPMHIVTTSKTQNDFTTIFVPTGNFL